MIYFIQDSRTDAIKIGYAADPEGRRAALQTGNAAELVLLLDMPGDRTFEAELHKQFGSSRIAGEWFRPTADLFKFILNAGRAQAHGAGQEVGAREYRANAAITACPALRPDEYSHDGNWSCHQVGYAQHVHCPLCGEDYNHIGNTRSVLGWESREHSPAPASLAWGGRGDGLALEMEGECGHRWLLCVATHKGYSFLFAAIDPAPVLESSDSQSPG